MTATSRPHHLISPFQSGKIALQNRLAFGSYFTALGADGHPSPAHVGYHEERARRGAGLITRAAKAILGNALTPDSLTTRSGSRLTLSKRGTRE